MRQTAVTANDAIVCLFGPRLEAKMNSPEVRAYFDPWQKKVQLNLEPENWVNVGGGFGRPIIIIIIIIIIINIINIINIIIIIIILPVKIRIQTPKQWVDTKSVLQLSSKRSRKSLAWTFGMWLGRRFEVWELCHLQNAKLRRSDLFFPTSLCGVLFLSVPTRRRPRPRPTASTPLVFIMEGTSLTHTTHLTHHSSHNSSHNSSHIHSSHHYYTSHTTHLTTTHLTPPIPHHSSSHTTLISPPLISHHPSHSTHHTTTHLTPLISHNTHLTQHSSHTTLISHNTHLTTAHLTPLIPHHSSSHHHSSHTTHLTPLIPHHSSSDAPSHHHSSHHHSSHTTTLILSWKAESFTCGVIRPFYFYNINQTRFWYN